MLQAAEQNKRIPVLIQIQKMNTPSLYYWEEQSFIMFLYIGLIITKLK